MWTTNTFLWLSSNCSPISQYKKKEFEAIEEAVGKKFSALFFVLPKNIFDECYKTVQKFEGTRGNILTVGFPKTSQFALCVDKTSFEP
jgi:hypothetical protein